MAALSDRPPKDSLRPAGSKLRVLFVGATPTDTARIAVGEEYRHVDAAVRTSDNAGRFEFHFAHEVRAAELGPALLRHRPHIVHFSGHGSATGELLLPDASGQAAPAKPEKLAQLFEVVGRDLSIHCVVLNACYSEALAKALAAQVDCVIGVPTALKDKVAVAFAGAFYQAIGFGQDLDAAYRYACAQVELAVPARAALPTIHCRGGVRAEEIRFLPAARSTLMRADARRAAPSGAAIDGSGAGRPRRWAQAALVAGVAVAVAAAALAVSMRARSSQTGPTPASRDAGVREARDASPVAPDAALTDAPAPEVVLRGAIVQHGRPLRDARVSVLGAECGATTDARGEFEVRCRGAALPRRLEATVRVGDRVSEAFHLHARGARYSVDRRGRVTTRSGPGDMEPRERDPAASTAAVRADAAAPTAVQADAATPAPRDTPRRECPFDDPGCNRVAP